MGIVYKARHRRLNRLVALKMIRGGVHADEIQIARFKIEAEAVAALRHPNILQIYDIGESDGLPYVALELLEGGSLADRLRGTPLPPRQAAEWMVPLVLAMDAAHRAGIVHRDLKSANILFTADGIPKITDFGLAKRLEMDEGQTHTGQVMGTPSYMAPEQARGDTKTVGPPADIYALGAILYEMLTGRPPFKGISAMETVKQVIERPGLAVARAVPRAARPRDDLHEMPAERAPQALRHREGNGRRPEPLPGRRADPGAPNAPDRARRQVGQTAPDRTPPCWPSRSSDAARRARHRCLVLEPPAGPGTDRRETRGHVARRDGRRPLPRPGAIVEERPRIKARSS